MPNTSFQQALTRSGFGPLNIGPMWNFLYDKQIVDEQFRRNLDGCHPSH